MIPPWSAPVGAPGISSTFAVPPVSRILAPGDVLAAGVAVRSIAVTLRWTPLPASCSAANIDSHAPHRGVTVWAALLNTPEATTPRTQ